MAKWAPDPGCLSIIGPSLPHHVGILSWKETQPHICPAPSVCCLTLPIELESCQNCLLHETVAYLKPKEFQSLFMHACMQPCSFIPSLAPFINSCVHSCRGAVAPLTPTFSCSQRLPTFPVPARHTGYRDRELSLAGPGPPGAFGPSGRDPSKWGLGA